MSEIITFGFDLAALFGDLSSDVRCSFGGILQTVPQRSAQSVAKGFGGAVTAD